MAFPSKHPAHVPDEAHDDPGNRVTIGEAAADEDGSEPIPTGLPPGRRGDTVDDEPETQETG
jgi:hypothetical protein